MSLYMDTIAYLIIKMNQTKFFHLSTSTRHECFTITCNFRDKKKVVKSITNKVILICYLACLMFNMSIETEIC